LGFSAGREVFALALFDSLGAAVPFAFALEEDDLLRVAGFAARLAGGFAAEGLPFALTAVALGSATSPPAAALRAGARKEIESTAMRV
jgi:hypothetical protein